MIKIILLSVLFHFIGIFSSNAQKLLLKADSFLNSSALDSARIYYRKTIDEARIKNDTLSEILGIKGLYNVHRNDYSEFNHSSFDTKLNAYAHSQYNDAFMRVLVAKGMYLFQMGQEQISINHLDSVYKFLTPEQKNGFLGATLLGTIGHAHNKLTDYEKSKSYYKRSLEIYQKIGMPDEVLRLKDHIAVVTRQLGNFDEAIKLHREVISDPNIKDNVLAYSCNNIGVAYESIEEYDLAKVYYIRAVALAKKLKLRALENFILNNLSTTLGNKVILEKELVKNRGLQRNILILVVVLVLITLVFIYTTFRARLKRQKKEVIQSEKLHQQEMSNMLQNLELRSINDMMDAMKNERDRVAKDLHDRLGGMMGALRISFDQIAETIKSEKPELTPKVVNTTMMLNESCEEIRKVAHNLAISSVSQFGLIQALRRLVDTIKEAKQVSISFSSSINKVELADESEMEIYKILQEILSNSLKHANAQEIDIQISIHNNILNIIIEDDGKGFDPARVKNGLGIVSVSERVNKLAGELNIDSKIGKGTTVIIDIPMS